MPYRIALKELLRHYSFNPITNVKLVFKEVRKKIPSVERYRWHVFSKPATKVKFHYLDAENARNSDRTSYPFQAKRGYFSIITVL